MTPPRLLAFLLSLPLWLAFTLRVILFFNVELGYALLNGPDGPALLRLLFVAGLTLLVLLGGYVLVYYARGQRAHVAAFTVRGRTHVTLNDLSPAVIGWSITCASALVLHSLVGAATDFAPGLPLALGCWLVTLGAGTLFTWRAEARMRSGGLDLILDGHTRRLSLPPIRNAEGIFERGDRLELDCARIQRVTLERHIHRDAEGHPSTRHRPTITYLDERGEPRQEAIVDWGLEERASALVLWLQKRLDARS